jgi:glycine cleavage system regulatory protein
LPLYVIHGRCAVGRPDAPGDRHAKQEEMVSTSLVLTVIGPDRPGLVESLSQVVASHQGSWLESRMARLAGQFAGILRTSVPEEQVDALTQALQLLESAGLHVGVARSQPTPLASDVRELRLEIIGSDRPGIVHEISEALADRGINVDELRTEIMSAPMSGELLFLANAELMVPVDLSLDLLRKDLEALAHELMVDVDLDEPL